MSASPSLCWFFFLFEPVQVLRVLSQSREFIRVSVPLCLDDAVSLESFTASDSYNLIASSSTPIPESGGEALDKGIPYRVSASKSLLFHTLFSCGSLC